MQSQMAASRVQADYAAALRVNDMPTDVMRLAKNCLIDTVASADMAGSLRLRDGRELSGQTDRPLGRGPTKPLPLPALEAKYLDCAGRVLDAGTARRGLETIWRLDELDSVAELPHLLAAGVSSPALAH